MSNNENDYYYDLYQQFKLTEAEVRQFKDFENVSDDELEYITDLIFDLAIVAQKTITEEDE